jgi:phosphoglycerate dehydrogenase-like enzyme
LKKILIISSSDEISKNIQKLKKIYKQVNIVQCLDNIEEIKNNINNINALINCPRYLFNSDLFNQVKNTLEWVHLGGAGVEEYLFPEFVNSNVILTNGKIIQGPEVSDHAIALLLCITRNLNYVLQHKTEIMPRPIELRGKKVLILGMGGIGNLIAEKLSSFGMYVIGVDQRLVSMNSYINEFHYLEDMSNTIKNADVVISAVPSTSVSNKIFSNKMFNKMKEGVIFINISRGKIVDTDALVDNLKKNKFYGVGLDVSDPEPLEPDHILRNDIRVVITPHIAGPSDHNRKRSLQILDKNLRNYISGLPLINIVNKKLEH